MRKALSALGICMVVFLVLAGTVSEISAAKAASVRARAVRAQAVRAQSMPPTDLSFYVAPRDTAARARQLGCHQARSDDTRGHGSFVTLDFGAQRKDGRGTFMPGTTVFWPNSKDENYALHFAYGYQACGPKHLLLLAVGTSNGGAVTNGALGAVWGGVVQATARQASARGYSHVVMQGAIDAEPGYGPFSHFAGWEWGDKSGRGYVSRTKALLSNYGSADGCPQKLGKYRNARCANGWTIANEYNAVWGWAPNEATPEIYFDGCGGYANMANQWAIVSAYGKYHERKGKVRFIGPLDQGNCLNSAAAWRAFTGALDKAGVSDAMSFSTTIVTR